MTETPFAAKPNLPSETLLSVRERTVALLSFLVFTGLITHLLINYVLPQRRQAALSARALDPQTLTEHWKDVREYMLVRSGEAVVGAASLAVYHDDATLGTFRSDFRLSMKINLLGTERAVDVAAASEMDRSFNLQRFFIEANLSPLRFRLTGMMDGTDLLVETGTAGTSPTRTRLQFDRSISLAEAVTPVATRRFPIKEGATFAIPVVDPIWSLDHGTLEFHVKAQESLKLGGTTVQAFPIEARLNDVTTLLYVDGEGNVLRRRLVGQFYLDRSTEQEVRRFELLTRPLQIPGLQASDFAGVESVRMSGLKPKAGRSPLQLLQGLTP